MTLKSVARTILAVIFCFFTALLFSCAGRGNEAKGPTPPAALDPKPKLESPKPKVTAPKPTKTPLSTPSLSPSIPISATPWAIPTFTEVGINASPTIEQGGEAMDLKLVSSAFKEGDFLDKKFTGDGMDVSPPLSWEKAPQGTKSFALIMDDPDAPMGTWVHWVIFNIPPDMTSLPENVPKNMQVLGKALQGKNDFGRVGYNGPAPPRGNPHRYFFKLYALDTELSLPALSTKDQVEKAMEGHILAKGQLMGMYKR